MFLWGGGLSVFTFFFLDILYIYTANQHKSVYSVRGTLMSEFALKDGIDLSHWSEFISFQEIKKWHILRKLMRAEDKIRKKTKKSS